MYKLIIIEDEKLTRDGIERLIHNRDTGFEVVGVASDGEQGLKLVSEKNPDVIITDICMPKMNGLDLIETAVELNPEAKIIIISGYDDFRYAQRAVRLGVQEYFLKPVLPEQIYDVLLKTKDDLEQRKNFLMNIENLKNRVLESLPVMKERFLNELISGSLSEEQIANKLKYLNMDMSCSLYAAIVLKIKNHASFSVPEVRKEDFLQYFLINVLDQVFDKNIMVYPFPISDYQIVLICCVKQVDSANVFITLNQNASRIVAKLHKYLNMTSYASIGKLYPNISELGKSYNEACEAMQYTFSKDGCYVINYEDISLQNQRLVEKPIELEKQFFVAVKLGERQVALNALESIFAAYGKDDIDNSNAIKMEVLEMVMLLARSIEETGSCSGNFHSSQTMSYEKIYKCDTLEELKNWFIGFVDLCINEFDKVKLGRSAAIAEKVKEYVQACLEDEEFSLDIVAEKLYMSPNYLRQIFKQHTGSSFVDYLTARRMEKAAALLQARTLKVQDISEMVGYSNQRYFASCFKKFYGLTPSEYREMQLT